jgi:glutathione synthase/RimK-type ligase-like ATP-grasp enzyme
MKWGRLMFRKVLTKDMKQGELYMTLMRETVWMGERETFWMVGKLERMTHVVIFSSARILRYTDHFHVYNRMSEISIPMDMEFYQLESRKQSIQEAMEKRAHHLILRKVLGDPCFTTDL